MAALRRVLQRCGIHLPFTDVICPQHVKTIWLRPDEYVETTIDCSLVFLSVPGPGSLRDVVPVRPHDERVIYKSEDGRDLARKTSGGTAFVYWTPRKTVTRYALYAHQLNWRVPGPTRDAAVYTDLSCELRTGILGVQMITPSTFESGVVFKRPRWRGLATEGSLMKYALKQLERGGEKPTILENGNRLEWSVPNPRRGERYVCVAFHPGGVALWQKRLAEKSLSARLRRLVRLPAA